MKNKHVLIIAALLTLNAYKLNAQSDTAKYFHLYGGYYLYVARDSIRMSGGIPYTAGFEAKIDESILFPVDPEDPIDPDTREINTSLPVGATSGSFNVTPSGAAVYQIPIFTSPGTAGVQPNISIVYNSQGGNGTLGYGWNIAGLSAISRIPKTIYNDGFNGGIELDTTDRFTLNGNRLICTYGKYGTASSQYRTEIESFVKVTAYNTAGTGPSYFIAETKNGTILEYGKTTDSRVEACGSSTVLLWRLSKLRDINGNYIEYVYGESKGESYIKQIKYTGNANAGINPYNEVNFYYEIRADSAKGYVAGSQQQNTLVLRKIKVTSEGKIAREYKFSYSYDFYTRLNEIKEFGNDGSQLNSTIVSWGNRTPSLQTTNLNYLSGAQVKGSGDFNGDGQTDFVIYWPAAFRVQFYLANANGTSFGSGPQFYLETGYEYQGFYVADINGDSKDDLIIKCYDDEEEEYFYDFYVSSSTGHSLTNDNIKLSDEHDFVTGDFTGDGLDDCVIANYEEHSWELYSYSYNNGTLSPLSLRDQGTDYIWYHHAYSEQQNVPIDINGNGKQEVLLLKIDGFYIVEYDGSDFNTIASGNDFDINDDITWGDYNGDGNTDICFDNGSGCKVRFSKGIGYIDISESIPGTLHYSQDMNGDGLMDLVGISGGVNSRIYIKLSKGIRFDTYSYYSPTETLTASNVYIHFGDFKGDGNIDLLYFDNSISRLYNIYQGKADMLVQSVTNGFNLKTSLTYKPMTDDNNFYTKGASSSFPVCDVQYPFYLVSSISGPDGIGGVNTVNYSYKAAKVHRQGKGYLGFASFTSSNSTTGLKSCQNFGYNPTYFNVFSTTAETRTTGNVLISRVTNTDSVKVLDGATKRIFPYVSQSVSFDTLTNTTVTSYRTFDNDGNLTNDSTTHGIDVITTMVNTYAKYGGWGPKNKITSSTVSKIYSGQPAYTRTRSFSYNTKGNITQEVYDPGMTKVVTQTYNYNDTACGLPKSITISASDISSRTNSMTYDAKYRFVTSRTNPLGHTVLYGYDHSLGVVTNEIDVNGHMTQYFYDGFGRLVNTILPTGKEINTELSWETSSPINALYSTQTSSPYSPTSTVYYDTLGRELRAVTTSFEGALIYADKEYYANGNLKRVRSPYKSGGAELWTTYYYDTYQRIDSIITPTCSTDYSYNGKTITITDCNGRSTTRTVNNAGDIISATDDNDETISYTYHSSGQPKQITAASSTTTMSYDEYGMQTVLSEPNAGTTNYTYNSLGQLITQINARNQKDSLMHDLLGRVTVKFSPEGTVTYTYDNTPDGKGMLSSVSGYGNTVTYGYDEYSRVDSITNHIDDSSYTTLYTYDNLKNTLSDISYPSGFAVTNEYDNYGYLKKVKRKDNSAKIWECTSMNQYGQITGASLGNNLSITKGYDQYGLPTSINTGSVQDMSFSFNTATGNLTWRKDNIRDITENFTYDNLDRLRRCQIGSNIDSITYNANGNISYKYGAGNYNYETKPHALTRLTNSPLSYSDNQITEYNSFNKPTTINYLNDSLIISYGIDNERIKTIYKNSSIGVNWTRKYLGNYEEVWSNGQLVKKIHYISGGDGLTAVYIMYGAGNDTMYYVSKDYQGNVMLLTRQNGSKAEEYSYDAWGRRRSPANWNDYNIATPAILYRGYTTHEHVDEFTLINMNGRMYDPLLGRFLSPDNIVQSSENTQSYNRYSYCLNNPLKYTDPSGWEYISPYFLGYPYHKDYDNNSYGTPLANAAANVAYTAPLQGYNQWTSWGYNGDWMAGSTEQAELHQYLAGWEYQSTITRLDNYFGAGYGEKAYSHVANGGIIESEPGFLVTLSSSGQIGIVMPGISSNNYLAIGQIIFKPLAPDPSTLLAYLPPEGGDEPFAEVNGSKYLGLGGEIGFNVLGEKLILGVHLFTNEYTSTYNGEWNYSKISYSGINAGYGPFGGKVHYNWTEKKWDFGLNLSSYNIETNRNSTFSILEGNLYLIGGISFEFKLNTNNVMNRLEDYTLWYYNETGRVPMISFH